MCDYACALRAELDDRSRSLTPIHFARESPTEVDTL